MATGSARRGNRGGFAGAPSAGFAAHGSRQIGFADQAPKTKASPRPKRNLGPNDTPATLPRIDIGRRLAGGHQGNEWRRFVRDFAQRNKLTELHVPEGQLIVGFMTSEQAKAMFQSRLDIAERPTKDDKRRLEELTRGINDRIDRMCSDEMDRVLALHDEDPTLRERIADPHNADIMLGAEEHGELIREYETAWEQGIFDAARLGATAVNTVSVLIGGRGERALRRNRDDTLNMLSDEFGLPVADHADEVWQPSLDIVHSRSGRPINRFQQFGAMPLEMTLKTPHIYTIS